MYSDRTKPTSLRPANTIEARDVKLGDRFEQNVEILEGVENGEKVAVSQLTRLDTGSKVTDR